MSLCTWFPFHFNHTHFCPVSSSCHVFIFLSLVRAHVHIRPHLSFSPPLGEACVCNPWNHRDPFGFCFTAGGPGILLLTWSDQARQQDGILELATPAYLRFFSNGARLSPEPQTADMHDTSSLRPARRPRSCALGNLSF